VERGGWRQATRPFLSAVGAAILFGSNGLNQGERQMPKRDEAFETELQRLREELAKGGSDLAAGRVIVLANGEDLQRFFDRL